MTGQLFIVSAPSGAGKTSLVHALLGQLAGIDVSVSHTTRRIRPGEVQGRDYHFVDIEAFRGMIAHDDFLEYAQVFGNYYGTSRSGVAAALAGGRDLVLEIDWQGARRIRELVPDAVSVFIMPPSLEELRHRLEGRGKDDPDTIARRMEAAREQMSHFDEYQYLIVNDEFERARDDLAAVVRATRLATPRQRAAGATAALAPGRGAQPGPMAS
jgi:guanylate kinase